VGGRWIESVGVELVVKVEADKGGDQRKRRKMIYIVVA
jgi:hypothetical protein